MAKTTFYEAAAYLADGREGSAKIPGETPGMGKHGTCVCVTAARQRKGNSGHTDQLS